MTCRANLPIIVGGFFRSGTSLVRRLLDSHSRIYCGPEVKFFSDFHGDYLWDPLAHLRFFSTARSTGLPEQELRRIFGSAFVNLRRSAAARSGKARWADKCPENVLYLDEWTDLLPQGFLFVYVVRHPFDVLASLKESPFKLTIPNDFSARIALIERYRRSYEAYRLKKPAVTFTVAYEDLVSAPDATLRALFNFLDESFEPEVMDRFADPERGAGLEDPKVTKSKSIHKAGIGRWKRDLSSEEIRQAQVLLANAIADLKDIR